MVYGEFPCFSTILNKFRETFLNIDMKVIEEFSDLFFGLW